MPPKPYPHNSSLAARRMRLAEAAATVETRRPSLLDLHAVVVDAANKAIEETGPPIPDFWIKGQLLNVRNNGAEYVVTVLGEEFDPRHPERALKFQNSVRCQDFVSKWYAREHSDPRAW